MKKILILNLDDGEENETINFLGQEIQIHQTGCHGDPEKAKNWIEMHDGQFDVIGLEGFPAVLQLGSAQKVHAIGQAFQKISRITPVVDGSGVQQGIERWGIVLANRAEPGIFSQKKILMAPGLNHQGLAQALNRHSSFIRYADPVVFFAIPQFPGVGSPRTLDRVAGLTLEQLKDAPFRRIFPRPGKAGTERAVDPFRWADVLAGDVGAIRRYAPQDLHHKTVVVLSASEQDLQDLRQRGVSIVVTLIPDLRGSSQLSGWGPATVEAVLASLRPSPDAPLTEDTYLDLIADLDWKPDIRYLQPEEAGINRFAFVIHPLSVAFIHQHKWLRWTRFFPNALVEAVAAWFPPLYLARIVGGKSPTTGQRIEGYLFALGATPRQMMNHGERFTYVRLNKAARMAERRGARIMGLGAFTSVIGDAGVTVAHEADIAITSGNSLTVAATLEAAKQAMIKMGTQDLTRGKAMVIGATGSIGAVCARLLAQAIYDVVLVSIEPERLIELKRRIHAETSRAQVTIATHADELAPMCDLIVTATSAFGQRVLDISRCKPGAVICDVARPPDINEIEADLRPDVLVIESGEVLIPGEIDFGYDIGLPPKTAYACLAETALLAMEGRFEDYTLGRDLSIEQVKEIYHLFKKHQFQLAGLRSFGQYITDEVIFQKRVLADRMRADLDLLEKIRDQAALQLEQIPVMAKGVRQDHQILEKRALLAAGIGLLGWFAIRRALSPRAGKII
jgi:predicted amino acid dehydrogenase